MMQFFQNLGASTRTSFTKLGRATYFLLETLSGVLSVLPRPRLLANQLYSVGVLSFLIISISGLFVGMVLGLQTAKQLVLFGAGQYVGGLVALSMARELAPTLTGVVVAAGRSESSAAVVRRPEA